MKYRLISFIYLFIFCPIFIFCQKNEKLEIEIHRPDLKKNIREINLFSRDKKINKKILVEELEGLLIYQGDMILGKVEDLEKNEDAISGNANRWNCSQVPYVISHPSVTNITDAINYMNANTNVQFIPRTSEADYVDFVEIPMGFSSSVGRQGGRQTINLQNNPPWGKVLHEMTHAIGYYHEHTRSDRDEFISVTPASMLSNINFIIQNDSYETENYDFESIMHYPLSGSVNGGSFTLVPLVSIPGGITVGQRTHYSALDIASINKIYRPVGTTIPDDLMVRDLPNDIGLQPNTISSTFYTSKDIWVNDLDNLPIHHNPVASQNNTVYVRVTNNGWCNTTDLTGQTLRGYWAKAGLGLGWTYPWDGSDPIMGGNLTPASGISIPSIPDGETTILAFNWVPNPPSMYTGIDPADRAHFCLLARIEQNITIPETANLWENVRNNNNIAWKNVQVEEMNDYSGVILSNPLPKIENQKYSLKIVIDKKDFKKRGKMILEVGEKTAKIFTKAKLKGIKRLGKNLFEITKSQALITNFVLPSKLDELVSVVYKRNTKTNSKDKVKVNLELLNYNNEVLGGEEFVFRNSIK